MTINTMETYNTSTHKEELNLQSIYSRYGGFWEYPDILDFCYLVNPFFSHSKIFDEMAAHFKTLISEYPAGMDVNCKLASKCWGIKQEYLIPGNGAAELIKTLMEDVEGNVGVVRPTFEEYPNRLPESRVTTFVPQKDSFRYGADDLIAFFEKNHVDNLLLINPDNPSGNFIPLKDIHRLAQWCEANNIRLILDESFVDFSFESTSNSFLDNHILELYPQMCVVKSISKSYGIPGLRLGILCSSNTALIARMKKQVSIWNINSFAEFFMQVFPKYREDYTYACKELIRAREVFEEGLREIPFIKIMPSQANFFFLEVLPPYKPLSLCETLLKRYHILASACLAKKGITTNRYMRIAVRTNRDNRMFINALRELAR